MSVDIVRNVLLRFRSLGVPMTPGEYARIYCEEAKKLGFSIPDCQKMASLLSRLDAPVAQMVKQAPVHTPEDLVYFLSAQLNRELGGHKQTMLNGYSQLLDRVFEAMELLHNEEAALLAKKARGRLAKPDAATVVHCKEEWEGFARRYDDSFLEPLLELVGTLPTSDLRRMTEGLVRWVGENNGETGQAEALTRVVLEAIRPVLASELNPEVEKIQTALNKNPARLYDMRVQQELLRFVERRAASERRKMQEEIKALEKVAEAVQSRLNGSLSTNAEAVSGIEQIKEEVGSALDESHAPFRARLMQMLESVGRQQENISQSLKTDLGEVGGLTEYVRRLERELEEVRREAQIDFMTKLYNRRAMDRYLERQAQLFERGGSDFAVAFFDLDHFKRVNDTFGHEAGDVVLQTFARIIGKSVRPGDLPGRWGGEEFLVLFPATDLRTAWGVAEKIRKAVEQTRFMFEEQRMPVTVSGGVALFSAHGAVETTIAASDTLLYHAKEQGRNRILS